MSDTNYFHKGKQSSTRDRVKEKRTNSYKRCDKKASLGWYKRNIKKARTQRMKPSIEDLEVNSPHPELDFSKIQKRKPH